jgi:DNA-binding winged helix-turn-helix (wHTH) protein
MSQAPLVPSADTAICAYRFAGVEFDLRRRVLIIDGVETGAKPLTLRLLCLLCEAEGRLLTRDELFTALWPGGQEISDAALSQQIWRLRTALGPYASLVATLRRNGVRLDAVVVALRASAAVEAASAEAVSPPYQIAPSHTVELVVGEPSEVPRRKARLRLVGLLAIAGIVALLAVLTFWRHDPVLNSGYGLRVSDTQAAHADTPRHLAAALDAALAGDRARAIAIMRSLHESDARTPLPALMLGAWASGDDPAQAQRWFDLAHARLTPQASPYLRLFVDYTTARALRQPVSGQIDAMLDLRPGAWLLQHTRSHAALVRRDFSSALKALRAIPLDVNDPALLADVLADRASLGDGDAEAIAWKIATIRNDPISTLYLRARFAWSHGHAAAAAEGFRRCAEAAAGNQRANDRRQECLRFAALAAVDAGSDDAIFLADAAARLAREFGYFAHEIDMWGVEAFLAARAGHADAAREALEEAWRRSTSPTDRAPLLLVALENGLPLPASVESVAGELPIEPIFGGVRQVLLGWAAWARGDRAEAMRQLDLAIERGVANTWHAEDAAFLAVRLGREAEQCRVDPPYPNPLRLTACVAMRDSKNK